MYLQDIKSSPSLTGQNNNKNYNMFHQVEFVDKKKLEAQNPRRDNSNLSISACLAMQGLHITKGWYRVVHLGPSTLINI